MTGWKWSIRRWCDSRGWKIEQWAQKDAGARFGTRSLWISDDDDREHRLSKDDDGDNRLSEDDDGDNRLSEDDDGDNRLSEDDAGGHYMDDMDGDQSNDDYHTVSWWATILIILGISAFFGLASYIFVCRRMQNRSRSEDFSAKVATVPDTPLESGRRDEVGRHSRDHIIGVGPTNQNGRESRASLHTPQRNSGDLRLTYSASQSSTRDFRQALMHDDEEATDILFRSRVLYDERGLRDINPSNTGEVSSSNLHPERVDYPWNRGINSRASGGNSLGTDSEYVPLATT